MKTGFIGAGNMAEAMIASLVGTKTLKPNEVFVSDSSAERRELVRRRHGVNVYKKNEMVVDEAGVVFLCVKPQVLDEVLAELAPRVTEDHLVISIAAGRRLDTIQALLPRARVVRVMPNLACLVGESMSVYCPGASVTKDDARVVDQLLASFGAVRELPEAMFDAVTAVSGSGPAFFCHFLLQMVEAGVREGLEREDALLLARQTMLGTARVLTEKETDPAELIRSVTSARGTTEAGMTEFQGSDLPQIVGRVIHAAAARSRALSA